MTDHKATENEWTNMEDSASDGFDDGYASCLIELRARIEALEAAANLRQQDEDVERVCEPTPNDRQIRSSLVKRVADAIESEAGSIFATVEARAAIREVAATLKDCGDLSGFALGRWLEQEAERG